MKVFFSPIARVREFFADDEPSTASKSYTIPIMPDAVDEFDGVHPAMVNTFGATLASLTLREGHLFRDDLCRLYLLCFFVDDATLSIILQVLERYNVRPPVFSDYKFVRAKHIRDKEATERYRKFVRQRYKVRFLPKRQGEQGETSIHTRHPPS